MFKVIEIATNEIVTVYDIRYGSSGYPHFLIHKGNEWLIRPAKHFKPLEE